jgi:hypothetical protein
VVLLGASWRPFVVLDGACGAGEVGDDGLECVEGWPEGDGERGVVEGGVFEEEVEEFALLGGREGGELVGDGVSEFEDSDARGQVVLVRVLEVVELVGEVVLSCSRVPGFLVVRVGGDAVVEAVLVELVEAALEPGFFVLESLDRCVVRSLFVLVAFAECLADPREEVRGEAEGAKRAHHLFGDGLFAYPGTTAGAVVLGAVVVRVPLLLSFRDEEATAVCAVDEAGVAELPRDVASATRSVWLTSCRPGEVAFRSSSPLAGA